MDTPGSKLCPNIASIKNAPPRPHECGKEEEEDEEDEDEEILRVGGIRCPNPAHHQVASSVCRSMSGEGESRNVDPNSTRENVKT